MKNKRVPSWYYIILFTIPILLIVLLEIALHIVNYGKDFNQWVEIDNGERLVLNPEIGEKYFQNVKNYPQSNNDSFKKIKDKSTTRIFVLGGSSAAGFPYQPNGTFTRYLRDRLQLNLENKNIEVINLGITAINSYTLLDMMPGIIEKDPDLIIIYAGHNEYYGALGVGSMESLGKNRSIITSYLSLSNYKTFQLVKNITQSLIRLFAPDNNETGNTLMARMASEKSIEFNSELYLKGIEQFEKNLEAILSIANDNNVKVLLGTVVSNLKDQIPFRSITKKSNGATNIFNLASRQYQQQNFEKSDSLFRIAKDFDALRFRAPEEINSIIKRLSKKFNYPLVDIDKNLAAQNNFEVVGKELMVDHLHPNLKGYLSIGKMIFENIYSSQLLTLKKETRSSLETQDSIVRSNFNFTRLDSISSSYRITNLLNDWPFKTEKDQSAILKIPRKNKIDSLAFNIVFDNKNWQVAHLEAANWYLQNDYYNDFAKEIENLISQYPFIYKYYNFAAEELIRVKEYELASRFLEQKNIIKPDYFSTKWMGNISLFKKNYLQAIEYLNESLGFSNSDYQVYYNLAIAYLNVGKKSLSMEMLKKAIELNENYTPAKKLLRDIIKKAE